MAAPKPVIVVEEGSTELPHFHAIRHIPGEALARDATLRQRPVVLITIAVPGGHVTTAETVLTGEHLSGEDLKQAVHLALVDMEAQAIDRFLEYLETADLRAAPVEGRPC